MKILHINLSDGAVGASIAANRLHKAFNISGHGSKMLVWQKFSADEHVRLLEQKAHWRLINRAVGKLLDEASLQYVFYPSSFRLLSHPWFCEADIVNLHIMHGGYFSFSVLPWLSNRVPVVLTLHDMWPMTGHCAVASYVECQRWQIGCGKCPQINDYPVIRRDTTRLLWKLKDIVYRKSHLHLICPSQWMAMQVQRSPLLNRFDFSHIPNGVDLQIFHPLPKAAARLVLDLDLEEPVLMFSAESLTKPRKGGRELSAALHKLVSRYNINPTLLLVGGGNLDGAINATDFSSFKIKHVGSVNNEFFMRICYSAADLVVLPTLADNLPSVLIEGLSCGTPCVSYKVGGVGEIVDHMETGYLARYRDVDDLAAGIALLITNSDLIKEMGERAPRVVANRFNITTQSQRYLDVFQRLIDKHNNTYKW